MVISSKFKWRAGLIAAAAISFFIAAAFGKNPDGSGDSRRDNPLMPGPNDPRIAYVTAQLLEEIHYLQEPLDTSLSEKFFDQYIGMLDSRRENFLQSDMDEFSFYRTNLGNFTMGGHGRADLTPAYVIYQRLCQRMQQHTAYAEQLLKQGHFAFDTDERIVIDRRHAPWPKNLADAQKLWRGQLEYEYLQEKLGREISPTNASVILPLPKDADAQIAEKLTHHYDWMLRMMTNWDSDNILQTYLDALTHAYDPHSDYLNTENAQSFSISMGLTLFGIGAQLGEDEGYCVIESLVPGGPAKRSGKVNARDRIIAVAQSNRPPVNVVDMELPKVVELIRGPKGTQVQLTLTTENDAATHRIVTLTRDEIKLADEHAKADLIERPDGHGGTNRIGVIDLPSFYASIDLPGNGDHSAQNYISTDTAKLIKKLKEENVSGIVLDLRGNPGGSLEEAVRFVGLFIKDGPVVVARSPDNHVSVDSDDDPQQLYSGPLVVLINRLSASAAEIAAAALQDYGRAIVVGDPSTFGKGTVQNLTPLRPFIWPATPTATNDPGTVKITIRKFYRVTGASTQFKGVASDIVLPDVLSYSTEIGETNLENPLPWDTISSVPFEKAGMVQPYLAQLKNNSAARVATNLDFGYIRQAISEFEKLQTNQTISLNEKEELQQRQQIAERDKQWDDERNSRKLPDEKVYEVTVDNVDNPGLPAPMSLTETNDTMAAATTSAATSNQVAAIKLTPVAFVKDPILNETENILRDYISVFTTNRSFVAGQ